MPTMWWHRYKRYWRKPGEIAATDTNVIGENPDFLHCDECGYKGPKAPFTPPSDNPDPRWDPTKHLKNLGYLDD